MSDARPTEAGFVFTLGELAAALGAELRGPASLPVTSYALDSRAVGPGTLFFALAGARTDGHLFLGDVARRGAAGAVVRPGADLPAGLPVLVTADVPAALARLGGLFRRRWPLTVVAITGSAGKTTTKEFAAALAATALPTFKSEGNLNSTLGLPLTLTRRRPADRVAVLELGMSTPGELRRVADIARPEVACITNVGLAHAANFATPEQIAREKASLLEAVGPGGCFVAGADDPRVAEMAARFPGRTIRYGLCAGVELRGRDLEPLGAAGTRFTWEWAGGSATAVLGLVGRHHVLNALAGLAVAAALGLDPLALAPAVARLAAGEHRGRLLRLAGDVTLLDDCYNSNPAALAAALATLETLPARRRVAVVGDMRELGEVAEREHRAAGRLAAAAARLVVAVGPDSRLLAEEAEAAGAEAVWLAGAEEAAVRVPALLRDGDAVLVKASRGVGLEVVVEAVGKERGPVA